jgi:opacity protein-like surface antigen
LKAAIFLTESQALASSLDSLSGSSADCGSVSATETCDANNVCHIVESTDASCEETGGVTKEDLAETHADAMEALDELMDTLKNEVFIEANLESDDGKVVIYKLPLSLVCGNDSQDDSDVAPVPEGAAPAPEEQASECETDYDKLQPRLRLSSPKDGDIDVGILLTSEKRNPITLQLYSDRIGATIDLGETLAALTAAGEDTSGVQELDGKISVELIRNSAQDYSLRGNVLEDVHVVAGDPGEEVSIVLAASEPTTELRLDGEAHTITGTLNYGALNVIAPLAAFANEEPIDEAGNVVPKTYTGSIDAVLGGLNGSLKFDGNEDALSFKGIGLGDVSTTVKFEGDTVMKLDVNPEDDRRFDLNVVAGAEGEDATITFSPTLDLRVLLNFAKLANQLDDIQGWMLDDTLRLWFDGANPSIALGDDFRVVSGTLHIDSSAHPESSLTAEAGVCLIASESEEEPTSLAAALTAGVCE